MSHFISKNMKILNHKIDRMMPMPESPFAFRDDESFRNLVESIRLYGLIDPIIVQPHPKNKDKIEIISGVRRWYACRELGRETILSASTADEMHQTRKRLRCSAERFRLRHRRCPKGKIGGR